MKKLIYIGILLGCNLTYAQVAIGKANVDGESAILDFESSTTNTLGLILPTVTSSANVLDTQDLGNNITRTLQNGTFIYDKADAKVKMREAGIWKDLSPVAGNSTGTIENLSDDIGHGTVIGEDEAGTTSASGVLVIESTQKAMILPLINQPEINVQGPYPGMICYDTSSKTLAVFDGTKWNYWK